MTQSRSKYYFVLLLTVLLQLLMTAGLHAQVLPLRQPEQDQQSAISICGTSFYTPYSYRGPGRVSDQSVWEPFSDAELETGNCKCNCAGETNSMWLKVTIATAGTLVFTITPEFLGDDYDFTVWDYQTAAALDFSSVAGFVGRRLRCNGNQVAGSDGLVGLNYVSALTYVRAGTTGNGFLKYLDVKAGDVLYIMIDNAATGFSASSSGFTIDFTGSTATFKNEDAPKPSTVITDCSNNTDSITIRVNQPIRCSSIAPDGSDFILSGGAATITNAYSPRCTGSADDYSYDLILKLSNPLPPGDYTLTSANGADGNTLISLCGGAMMTGEVLPFKASEPLKISAGNDIAICPGVKSATLSVTISGGSNNQIFWPSYDIDNQYFATTTVVPRKDGYYYVEVYPFNRNECIVRDTVNVVFLKGFNLQNKDTAICKGDPVTIRANGDKDYIYKWQPATGLSDPAVINPVATPEATSVYTLTASYPGCKDSVTALKISVEPVPVTYIGEDTIYCKGDVLMMQPRTEPASYKDYIYKWTPADAFNNANISNPLFNAAADADITLQVSTPAGCNTTDQRKVSVYSRSRPNAGNDTTMIAGKPIILQGSINDPLVTIHWTPAASLSNPQTLHPVASPETSQLYYLMADDRGYCKTYDSVFITVLKELRFPNAFSPNGDGINEKWEIPGLSGYPQSKIEVFNRRGQSVFRSNGYSSPWDGRMNGKPLPADVYYYIITTGISGVGRQSGTVMILR